MKLNVLEWMQEWVWQNCNDDWEHAQNFTITTIDNPGWSVTINLAGTRLENETFFTVDIENNDTDWLYCKVKNQQFQGDCGIRNLHQMLEIFIKWAESFPKNN